MVPKDPKTPGEDDLGRLAEIAGIVPSYQDVRGGRHQVPDETRRTALSAMGLPAGDRQQLAAALAALQRRDQPLPPVLVVSGNAAEVPLTLSADHPDDISWRIELEDGGTLGGRETLRTLPPWSNGDADHAAGCRRLSLPASLPAGYHRLVVEDRDGSRTSVLVVGAERCWMPAGAPAPESRIWGVSCQLYSLRSQRNWGIGDFTDLRHLAVAAAAKGASLIALNPLHALFPNDPSRYSPYSPSSRLFLNFLYIDPEAVPEFGESETARMQVADPRFQARLELLRQTEFIDYPGVTAVKREILEILYQEFRHGRPAGERQAAFEEFRQERGSALVSHARFEALSEHFSRLPGASLEWSNWPQPYQDHASAEVAEFARSKEERIGFYMYLQWLADEQLAAVHRACVDHGMPIGLYRDLAVGADRGGAETWLEPRRFVRSMNVGAPPDEFNQLGQDWGLPPLNPLVLQENAFAGFIDIIRANMRHAGAVRIDHMMALMRVYWVPAGATAKDGFYVRYPLTDLLRILALESRRSRCVVVGEALGTVPEGFLDTLEAAGVLGYRVLYFERTSDGGFAAPDSYPTLALAVVSTHDLPTLVGWWQGHDVEVRQRFNLFPDPDGADQELQRRQVERERLLQALVEQGLIDRADPAAPAPAAALHRFLARTQSWITLVQIEDVLGETEQMNLPGTIDEHPNWRRKLSLDLDLLVEDPVFAEIAELMQRERPGLRPAVGLDAGTMLVRPSTPDEQRPLQ